MGKLPAALPPKLYLSDTMAKWPWARAINSHYHEVKAETTRWFRGFKALNDRSQYAFDKGDFTLLAALTYPWASKEHLRLGSDWLYLLFLIDEYTDVESAEAVRGIVNTISDAMRNPHKQRPHGESSVGEITRDFWKRFITMASPSCQKHMVDGFTRYLESVIVQAADRDSDPELTVEEFMDRRLENAGVPPGLIPMEFGLNLPDEAFYHPTVAELSNCCIELVVIDNDIASYNKEQAIGDDLCNTLTVAMRHFNITFDDAMLWAADRHAKVEARFHDALLRVPSFGPEIDPQLQHYMLGLANWPRGSYCWSFEGGRYFGDKGFEYKHTRLVPLLPRVSKYAENGLHGEDVIVPLIAELEG